MTAVHHERKASVFETAATAAGTTPVTGVRWPLRKALAVGLPLLACIVSSSASAAVTLMRIGSESAVFTSDGGDNLAAKYIVRFGGGLKYNTTLKNADGSAASSAQITTSRAGDTVSIALVASASMLAGAYGVSNGSGVAIGIGNGCFCGGKAPNPPVASFTLTKPATYSVSGNYANVTGGVQNYVYAAIYSAAGSLIAQYVSPGPAGQSPSSGAISGSGVLPAGSYMYQAFYVLSNYTGDGASDAFAPSGYGSVTLTLTPTGAH